MGAIVNALTIDVEDYYHVAAFDRVINPDRWSNMESRFARNTHVLLDLFDAHQVRATFFVLGWCAEREPGLVMEIAKRGHEVASHGYSHKLIYTQHPDDFKYETQKSKDLLESIIGRPVKGYRAASYSITAKSLWALDILCETGFEYDSSIFPIYHDRYGISDSPETIYKIKTAQGNCLTEFPMSVAKLGRIKIPVSGGGYFRLFPYWLTRLGLKSISQRGQRPFVFYLHPWEVDPAQPKIQASWFSRFRHYNNLDVCELRLANLLREFEFTTMENVLKQHPPEVEYTDFCS
ncbi:MAG TPA: XrtA system polysaccharide deacetylase [Pseudomonadales bacterium]|nr:XrtA system polysaccharide deacetylase [Pseudomonadales bacterium]